MEIVISNLSKKLKGTPVLDQISLELRSGKIYGLQGINGSGKTMLMRAICGLILPTEGEIRIDGKCIGKEIDFPESMGLMLENPSFLPGYTAFDNLKLLAGIRRRIGEDEIRRALISVGLDPQDKRKYRKFSLGMKQRLGIACAVMEDPELVILDEPFNALDEDGIRLVGEILENLRRLGRLVILSCHDKEELIRLCDEIFLMKNGKLYREEQG